MENKQKPKRQNFFIEILKFIWIKKVYWIAPLIILLVLLALLIIYGTSPVMPFVYTII